MQRHQVLGEQVRADLAVGQRPDAPNTGNGGAVPRVSKQELRDTGGAVDVEEVGAQCADRPGDVDAVLHFFTGVLAAAGAWFLVVDGGEPEVSGLGRLGFDDLWRRFFDDGCENGGAAISSPTAISVDTSIAAIEIVATGSLWSIIPERFARQAIKDGRIFQAPGEPILMRQAHYLLRPDNAEPLSGQAVAFCRWLQDQDDIDPGLA